MLSGTVGSRNVHHHDLTVFQPYDEIIVHLARPLLLGVFFESLKRFARKIGERLEIESKQRIIDLQPLWQYINPLRFPTSCLFATSTITSNLTVSSAPIQQEKADADPLGLPLRRRQLCHSAR